MKILGIETSCDETAAAVVEDGQKLLSNAVLSSMDLHVAYGGVVPEIAARSHIESIQPVINKALHDAFVANTEQGAGSKGHRTQITEHRLQNTDYRQRTTEDRKQITENRQRTTESNPWDEIDAIAVTHGAGLGGSLLVGVMAARTYAITKNKPLYAINHVEAHIYANFLTGIAESSKLKADSYRLRAKSPAFPMLGLIVSGGHSQIVIWRDHFDYTLLGQTTDDAIGEAFDKVAKLLGLPYPGGPSIGQKAKDGDPYAYDLPKAKLQDKYNYSFSGLKTAVLRLAQKEIGMDHHFPSHKIAERLSEAQKADIAASFQRTAIETVVDKVAAAYEEFQPESVVIGGGVAANPELRRQLAERLPIPIEYTDPQLMTDNGAMIATLGCFKMMHNQPQADPYTLDIKPNLSM
ncbi:MAG: tRNA (adenosine(37)-N6)-threonylcarbamoyltransferase complex transferase subunit TsaD [Candidatus Saccharibacteria bacterium]|nr:tRNA (adenosine(37)-N6)-threonylcarbamoyltransferase complex transferase subunit TsaD [Candidatus Saccharibacteria bacterium]